MRSASSTMRTIALLLFAAVVVFALAACPGPTFVVQQYGGPQRPQETVAIVRVNGREPIRLLVLDDQDVAAPIEQDSRLHIEVLPGRHTVVVGNAKAPNERYTPITFQAEAGKVYRVGITPDGEARMYEVDRGKDAVVRDVTQSLETAPAPAPRPIERTVPPVDDAGEPPADAGETLSPVDGG